MAKNDAYDEVAKKVPKKKKKKFDSDEWNEMKKKELEDDEDLEVVDAEVMA